LGDGFCVLGGLTGAGTLAVLQENITKEKINKKLNVEIFGFEMNII
jgi:hypothetical protein